MATLAQFRTRIGRKLGLDYTTSNDERDAIDEWVNEGVVDVLLKTQVKVKSQTVTPATADYSLTSAVLAIVSMYFTTGGSDYALEQVTVEELLELRRNGATPTATGTSHFAVAGSDLILFWPTPGATDTVTMYYVASPTALSVSTDDPSTSANGGIPVEFHKAIEYYALAEAGDYDDDTSSAQGQRYRDRYQEELGRIRRALIKRGGKLPRARLGRSSRFARPSDGDWR